MHWSRRGPSSASPRCAAPPRRRWRTLNCAVAGTTAAMAARPLPPPRPALSQSPNIALVAIGPHQHPPSAQVKARLGRTCAPLAVVRLPPAASASAWMMCGTPTTMRACGRNSHSTATQAERTRSEGVATYDSHHRSLPPIQQAHPSSGRPGNGRRVAQVPTVCTVCTCISYMAMWFVSPHCQVPPLPWPSQMSTRHLWASHSHHPRPCRPPIRLSPSCDGHQARVKSVNRATLPPRPHQLLTATEAAWPPPPLSPGARWATAPPPACLAWATGRRRRPAPRP